MNAPHRRGACPGLSAPMLTGDGLLVRLTPSGATIALDAFAGLCVAARQHGNGIIEITSRGNIQFRGLTASSAPAFAVAVGSLDIEVSEGTPVLANPLSGLDTGEISTPVRSRGYCARRLRRLRLPPTSPRSFPS